MWWLMQSYLLKKQIFNTKIFQLGFRVFNPDPGHGFRSFSSVDLVTQRVFKENLLQTQVCLTRMRNLKFPSENWHAPSSHLLYVLGNFLKKRFVISPTKKR